MTMERHIVGLGGGGDTPEQTDLLHDYVLGLTGKERPRVLWVPTASADNSEYTVGSTRASRGLPRSAR